jgi:NADH dehydrogenase
MKYDYVIAGGGFAGAYCARELSRKLGPGRVALVAERNVMVFHPMLAEVAGSSLGPMDVVNPLRQLCKHATVLQGSVQRVDWASQQIVVDGGRFTRDQHIGFGHLVLALGSITNVNQIPGFSEHGWPMKNVADALRLRTALINRLEEANLVDDPVVRARLLTFVVVGGGYTGVETAGQLRGFFRQALKFYPALQAVPCRLVLVHSGPELLPEIGPKLGGHALRVLERRGVEVRLNTRVESMTSRKVVFVGGEFIEAHTVITTIGTAPNPVIQALARELKLEMPKGRLSVEPTMKVPGYANLWAIGDCAGVPWNDRGEQKLAPPTAQLALREGRQLAANLLRLEKGAPLLPFTYRYLGQLATIGEHEAVAEVMGFHFQGFIAWWMWRTIYLAKLPGAVRKLRVMIDWTMELIFPPDISVLLPPPDEVMRPIHLESDEVLFEKGSTARAVFYVRKGAVTLSATASKPERTISSGEVIDRDEADEHSLWTCTARATETSDIIVFRGRAFALMRDELKLSARSSAKQAP